MQHKKGITPQHITINISFILTLHFNHYPESSQPSIVLTSLASIQVIKSDFVPSYSE